MLSIISFLEHRGSQRVAKMLLQGKEKSFSLSSLRLARGKIGWGFLRRTLVALFNQHEKIYGQRHCWKGLRLFAIDGSLVNLPMELKKIKYRSNDKNAAYPMGLVSVLYRIGANLPANIEICRHRDERRAAKHHLVSLSHKDLVIFDRGYISYDFLDYVHKKGIQAIFRVPKSSCKDLNLCWTGEADREILIRKQGSEIKIRVVRIKIRSTTYLFATTLLDRKKYPMLAIAQLFKERWNIEEGFKTIKNIYSLEKFSSRNSIGVKQDILMATILVFFARLLEEPKKSKDFIQKNNGKVAASLMLSYFSTNSRDLNSVPKKPIRQLFELARANSMKYSRDRHFKRKSRLPPQKWRPPRKRYKPRKIEEG